jgi:(2Fe-2S) ferredoxin
MNLYKIAVCAGPNCSARFSADVKKRFEQLVAKKNLGANVIVGDGGCYGRCTRGPNVLIIGPIPREDESNYRRFKVVPNPKVAKQMYNGVSPNDCDELVESHCVRGEILDRMKDTQLG